MQGQSPEGASWSAVSQVLRRHLLGLVEGRAIYLNGTVTGPGWRT
jgi:hypothetical protein